MTTFLDIRRAADTLLEPVPNGPGSYRMKGYALPWSVTPQEGRFLYEMAEFAAMGRRHPRAFEIATAFGYSALWIAAGLGCEGYLVTMDSYVEERSSDQVLDHGVNPDPKGLVVARALSVESSLAQRIGYAIGSSPVDVDGILRAFNGGRTLDAGLLSFAFIDGHHLNGQPLKDWNAVEGYLNPLESVVVFHDTHLPSVKEAVTACESFFGTTHFNPHLRGFSIVVVAPKNVERRVLQACADRCHRPYE